MPRLLFEKTGNAVWISHLDLMRLFQRAFKRAGLPLKHTQGFNPRPSVSIALPLSVGVSSKCELLDFELEDSDIGSGDIRDKLNDALVCGVRVLDVYETGRKVRELSLLRCCVSFEYDRGIPKGAVEAILNLFCRDTLVVPKKTKSGTVDQDIIPMIRNMQVHKTGDRQLTLESLVWCQNPTLNPAQLTAAVNMYLPEMKPDFTACSRIEIYDNQEIVFR